MSTIRTAENLATLAVVSVTTVQFPPSRFNIGALQYVNTTPLTLNITFSGAGGIDAGSVQASTPYYVYAVISGGSPALIASQNSSLPSGFTQARVVGGLNTDVNSQVVNIFQIPVNLNFDNVNVAGTTVFPGNTTIDSIGNESIAGNLTVAGTVTVAGATVHNGSNTNNGSTSLLGGVGIGAAPSSSSGLYIQSTGSGTTQNGLRITSNFATPPTVSAAAINVNSGLPAGSYTVNSYASFQDSGAFLPGTATLNNFYGLYLGTPTLNGTVFNRFGIYQGDAAAFNYFSGKTGIGMTPVNTLDVTGTFGSTGNATIGGSLTVTGASNLNNYLYMGNGFPIVATTGHLLALSSGGGTTDIRLNYNYGGGSGGVGIYDGGTSNYTQLTSTGGTFSVVPSAGITNITGNLGIGVSPQVKLHSQITGNGEVARFESTGTGTNTLKINQYSGYAAGAFQKLAFTQGTTAATETAAILWDFNNQQLTLSTSGATTGISLNTSGAVSIPGTLTSGNTTTNGSGSITGTLSVGSAASIGGQLLLTGAASLSSSLDVATDFSVHKYDDNSLNTVTIATAGKSFIRLTTGSSVTVAGLSGGFSGKRVTLLNFTAGAVTILNNSSFAASGDRINFNNIYNRTLPSGGSIEFIYDASSSHWYALDGGVGVALSDWTTFTGSTAWTNVNTSCKYRRVGDTMQIQYYITSTSGSTGSAGLTVNIPAGFTIDYTKLATGGGGYILGGGFASQTGYGNCTPLFPFVGSTTQIGFLSNQNSSQGFPLSGVSPTLTFAFGTFSSSTQTSSVTVWFEVPIVGWTST